jgi:hypothetical protein
MDWSKSEFCFRVAAAAAERDEPTKLATRFHFRLNSKLSRVRFSPIGLRLLLL